MNFLVRIISHFKKSKVIIITGKERSETSKRVFQILKPHFSVKQFIEKAPNILDVLRNEVLLIETDLKDQKILKRTSNLTKICQLPILVATNVAEISQNSDFFAGEEKEVAEIKDLAQLIPPYGFLILNFDDKIVRRIDNVTNLKSFTFGFQEEADFRVSDIHKNQGTNFKINYKGNTIPIWQEEVLEKNGIYNSVAASCVGIILGLNFVQISEALKK